MNIKSYIALRRTHEVSELDKPHDQILDISLITTTLGQSLVKVGDCFRDFPELKGTPADLDLEELIRMSSPASSQLEFDEEDVCDALGN